MPKALRQRVRINYWTTSCLEPDIEAISKEIFDLVDHFQESRIFSVSPHLGALIRRRGRILGFNPAFDPALRVLIPLLERTCDINHVYSEVSPWIYHRTLRKRPTVLTIASEKGVLIREFLSRCDRVVVQTERMMQRLLELELPPGKVNLIYPGIDLSSFRPQGRVPGGAPTVLFATFPRTEEELQDRGVHFLMEAAAGLPSVSFRFVSRPWKGGSTALDAVKNMIDERGMRNIQVFEGTQTDMSALYANVDFTVIPYAVADGGKECPRSLVESLACGIPVLISQPAPFSSFIERNDCGAVFPLSVAGFSDAMDRALVRYRSQSYNASASAVRFFDRQSMLKEYADLYDSLMRGEGSK